MSVAQKRERVLPRLIEEEMREAFLDYSMSVIVQRALPDVRDGLKPVHRRILYAMRELGLLPDRPHKKSATVVGEVLGKYHPHGDTAVYDTLVRMVQDFSLRYPLIDGQGNFGSIDGDAAAAYRYTEARLAAISLELLDDLDKETVDWSPNFDDRLLEPSVLPARLPNLLVNGSAGIAVGMSTNIPPHNLTEVTGAFRVLAANPDCTLDDLMEHVPGPDFPTGGFILGTDGIRDMYATGRGRLIVRGRLRKEALRGGRSQLVVTELPYGVSKVRVIEQIVDLSKKGRLEDVSDVRDESDRDGMRLVIELKRGASAPKTIQTLYKRTHLQGTFGAIVLALDNGEPKELTLKQMLERYRDHRLEVVVRRSRFDLEKAEAELHIVQGLLLALDQIDEVIRIIKDSEDRAEAHERLLDTFGLSELQADAILNMRLARLTALEGDQLRDRSAALAIDIANLRGLLGSEEEQLAVVVAELEAADERFGDDRRTQIVEEGEPEEEATEQVMADEDVVVTVSHQGFLKRMPVHLYRRRVNAGKALAGMESYEDDWLSRVFTARTQGWLLAFTEGGHAHFLSVLDVPESSRASRGQSIYALTGADREDPIVALLPVEDLADEAAYLVFVTRGGIVKRTALSEFSNPRAGGIIASGVKKGDGIIDVAVSDGRADVVLMTRGGRAIRFREKDVPVVGRPAQGVKGVGLRGDDRVVSVVMVRREAAVMTIDDRGWGKRTPIGEFPLQKRGGLGTMALPADSDGGIVAALEVVAGDEVSAVTAAGIVSQLEAESIPEQGRRTRGASLLTLEGDDRVVEVARSAGGAGSGSGTGGEGGGTEDSGPDPADGEETDEVDTDPGDGVDDGEETDDGDGTDDGDETDDGDGARNGKAGQSDLFGS